ncbi:MAG: SGNH/GDSL hydrolase family protein [Clostridia bacterium]|nr:SGNH/GDSL hydrolase family protein [Clostridia bacterium]
MYKIALIGDSIRLSYGKVVPELLGEDYQVWQPTDNCRFSAYTLRGMWDWQKELDGMDVIHWNNGLWDACDLFDDGPFTRPEVYVDTMKRIAGIMQKHAKKVIFATTTPVDPRNPHDSNDRIQLFNSLIVPELEKMGIIINDLHSLVYPKIDEYIREDRLHLSEVGVAAASAQVADAIRKVCETL